MSETREAGDGGQRVLHVLVVGRREPRSETLGARQRRQALLDVAAVPLDVATDHRVDDVAVARFKNALFDQDLSQWFELVEHPGIHARDELVAGDEVHLQREDAEEQVAVGVRRGHGVAPLGETRSRLRPGLCIIAGPHTEKPGCRGRNAGGRTRRRGRPLGG